jgi:hypothetical protein
VQGKCGKKGASKQGVDKNDKIIYIRSVVMIPDGFNVSNYTSITRGNGYTYEGARDQEEGELQVNKTPDGAREAKLEEYGLAVTGGLEELWFRPEWTHDRLTQWLEEKFPQAFQWLDSLDSLDHVKRWFLLQTYRGKLTTRRLNSDGFDFERARGIAGRPWSEHTIYIGVSRRFSVWGLPDLKLPHSRRRYYSGSTVQE